MAPKPRPAASDSSSTCSQEEDEEEQGSHGDAGDQTDSSDETEGNWVLAKRQPAPPPPKRKAPAAAELAGTSRPKKTQASSRKLAKNKAPASVAPAAAGAGENQLGDKTASYRFLWEEVVAVDAENPGGMFKDLFSKVPDAEASALNAKVKKQRKAEIQVHLRWIDVAKDIFRTLIDNLE